MKELKIRQYPSGFLSSNMYALLSNDRLLVIDPWCSEDLLALINKGFLTVDYILLTHEHYDHISGVNWLKAITNCKVLCNKLCSEAIKKPSQNFSKYFDILVELIAQGSNTKEVFEIEPYSCDADIIFEDIMVMEWEGHKIDLVSTPGHSKGSICILIDNKYLFAGDSLLKDYPTVTKLNGGNIKEYNEKTIEYLKLLNTDIRVYPGHYDIFSLKDKLKNTNISVSDDAL